MLGICVNVIGLIIFFLFQHSVVPEVFYFMGIGDFGRLHSGISF